MKVHEIKIQAKFDFGVRRAKVKGHSSLNMREKKSHLVSEPCSEQGSHFAELEP